MLSVLPVRRPATITVMFAPISCVRRWGVKFKVLTTPEFESQSKALQKRHRSFKNDLKALVLSLMENPFQGTELSPGIRKIRIAVTSKGRGKSGGARIITYTIVAAESEGRFYLMNVYDKSDFSSVELPIIKYMIRDLE